MALPQDIRPINNELADSITRSAEIPWIETRPGQAWTKVLWVGPESGRWAVLLRWKKGYVAPPHKHLSAAFAFVLSGRLKVRDNVFMLTGAGGNITALTFPEGVLLVDTGAAQSAHAVLDAINRLSPKPIAHIINTSASAEHIGGNEVLAASGRRIPGEVVAGEGPMVVAHENVLTRLSAPTGKEAAALPLIEAAPDAEFLPGGERALKALRLDRAARANALGLADLGVAPLPGEEQVRVGGRTGRVPHPGLGARGRAVAVRAGAPAARGTGRL